MANNFFKFKQFTVRQDKCAMKVTTVACIQGAWLPDCAPKNILDIGAGTGLLSLMAAQKYDCSVDAVEIDGQAFLQLQENTRNSSWSNRISCFHRDIRKFTGQKTGKYDLIITNPPFYQNQLLSPDERKNKARHHHSLNAAELSASLTRLLDENGVVSVLLPPEEAGHFEALCKQSGLHLNKRLMIADNPNKSASASVSILSYQLTEPDVSKLNIKESDGAYSKDFYSLLKDYYLYL